MHLSTAAYLLATSLALCQAQTLSTPASAAASQVAAGPDHWCGDWAGKPTPSNVPSGQQLPADDPIRRFFVEPQLQKVPFSPIIASEPKVQIPKIWGNGKSLHCCQGFLNLANPIPSRQLPSCTAQLRNFEACPTYLLQQQIEMVRFPQSA